MAEVNTPSTGTVESPKVDAYREWQQAQEIPRVTGIYVPDVNELELAEGFVNVGGVDHFVSLLI